MKIIFIFLAVLYFSSFSYSQQKSSVNSNSSIKFKSVKIGEQVWMSENLNVSNFRNGDPIPQVKSKNELQFSVSPAWCYYDFDNSNEKKMGKLYNLYALTDPRGLAPEGWHIPTGNEWSSLIEQLGGLNDAAKKIKSTAGWKSPTKNIICEKCKDWSDEYRKKVPCHYCKDSKISGHYQVYNNNGNNSSGFNSIPSGFYIRYYDVNEFLRKETEAVYWHEPRWKNEELTASTTEVWNEKGEFIFQGVSNNELQINRFPAAEYCFFSVRCIKNDQNYDQKQILYAQIQKAIEICDVDFAILNIDGLTEDEVKYKYSVQLAKKLALKIDQTLKENKLDLAINLIDKYKNLKYYDSYKVHEWQNLMEPILKEQEYQIAFIENRSTINKLKQKALSELEGLFIGRWSFESKNINLKNGNIIKMEEEWLVNSDRTYTYSSKYKNMRDKTYFGNYSEKGVFEISTENNSIVVIAHITEENGKPSIRIDNMKFDEINEKRASRTLIFNEAKAPTKLNGKKL